MLQERANKISKYIVMLIYRILLTNRLLKILRSRYLMYKFYINVRIIIQPNGKLINVYLPKNSCFRKIYTYIEVC